MRAANSCFSFASLPVVLENSYPTLLLDVCHRRFSWPSAARQNIPFAFKAIYENEWQTSLRALDALTKCDALVWWQKPECVKVFWCGSLCDVNKANSTSVHLIGEKQHTQTKKKKNRTAEKHLRGEKETASISDHDNDNYLCHHYSQYTDTNI